MTDVNVKIGELFPDKVFLHLIVGITGHRDIIDKDKPMLKTRIKEVFKKLKDNCPNTPLLLLTPLAEGADRLAAEVAIEEGIKYIVPLPLPKEEYEKDFPETIYELECYLKNPFCIGSFEIPETEYEKRWVDKKKLANDNEYEYKCVRKKRYEAVGAYIVRYSQVLIALWDGEVSEETGGTYRIVKFQQEGLPEEYSPNRDPLDISDKGLLYHILTRREGADISRSYKAKLQVGLPEETGIK